MGNAFMQPFVRLRHFESTVSRQKENFVCSAESPTRLGNAWQIIFLKWRQRRSSLWNLRCFPDLYLPIPGLLSFLEDFKIRGKWSLITKHGFCGMYGKS